MDSRDPRLAAAVADRAPRSRSAIPARPRVPVPRLSAVRPGDWTSVAGHPALDHQGMDDGPLGSGIIRSQFAARKLPTVRLEAS
jgi:hypothetical protein